jgi:hypothetical protein
MKGGRPVKGPVFFGKFGVVFAECAFVRLYAKIPNFRAKTRKLLVI